MSRTTTTIAFAAGLGLIAGMRSMAAPALLSHFLSRRPAHGGHAVTRLLASRRTAAVLKLLAAGEMAADKTPFVPDRTDLSALVGRVSMGALCGAAIAGRRATSPVGAALAGSAGALCSTVLVYHLRKRLGAASGLPDPVLGLVEDGVALTAGSKLAAAVG